MPGVLDPQGPVAAAERLLLIDATGIMLVVVVPVIVMTFAFAWRYRASNTRAVYRPDWAYSGQIELTVWSIPTMVVLLLGGVGWISSHALDPAKPLSATVPPLRIEVVSLDWHWLFIYPDAQVATVGDLVVPVGVPIDFELTSATVMSAFFVPQLGSQIYTMPGMTTHLNLLADRPGTYPGLSAQFSGDGFSDMRFDTVALDKQGFEDWVKTTRSGGGKLDAESYAKLAQPSSAVPPSTYGDVAPRLFETLAMADPPGPATADAGPKICVAPRARN